MTKGEAQTFERIMAKLAPVVAEAVTAETKANGKVEAKPAPAPKVEAKPAPKVESDTVSDLEITVNSPEDAERYGRPGDPAVLRVTRWIDTRKGRVATKSISLRVSELEALVEVYATLGAPVAA